METTRKTVRQYVNERVGNFRLTDDLRRALINNQSAALWNARWKALTEALPWVFGIIAFIWVFTAVMGWIIRGFAGVPQGQDFRTPKAEA